jgi:hypothetical protein
MPPQKQQANRDKYAPHQQPKLPQVAVAGLQLFEVFANVHGN